MKSIKNFILEAVKNFTLTKDERNALVEAVGVMLGDLGEDRDVIRYQDFVNGLTNDEHDQYKDLYDVLSDISTYPKVTSRIIKDDVPLLMKLLTWMDENNLLGENWDLIDAYDKMK